MMGKRKTGDVFVIGGESLDVETQDLQVPRLEPDAEGQEPGGAPPPGLGPSVARGSSRRARGLAVLGLAAAAATTAALLESSSSDESRHPQADRTSARPALVSRPAPVAAASPLPRSQNRSDQSETARPRRGHPNEPEREPAPTPMAPASSPGPQSPMVEPVPASTPPSPPPPSSGGGPGGVEDFGFER